MTIRPIGSQAFLHKVYGSTCRADTGGVRTGTSDTLSEITRWQRQRGRDGGGERETEIETHDALQPELPYQRQPSAQYGRPHQPSDLLTNEWERCQSAQRTGERRSSLLPGIIAQRRGGTTLASEG